MWVNCSAALSQHLLKFFLRNLNPCRDLPAVQKKEKKTLYESRYKKLGEKCSKVIKPRACLVMKII